MKVVEWGVVTDVGSPVLVRLVGDSADTPCPLANENLVSIAEGDKVLLNHAGGTWIIVAILETT